MNKEQAIEIVGIDAIEALEAENCEPTNRVGYRGLAGGDQLTEWAASVTCKDKDGNDCCVTAYYYTSNDEDKAIADADGDGSAIVWEIDRYEIK